MGEPDSKTRSKEISEMLDYSYAQYKIDNLLKNKTSVGKYEVDKGKEKYVKVIPKGGATVLRKKSDKSGNASFNIKLKNLRAPLKKGDVVGKLKIKENNKVIRTVELTVDKDVKMANIIELYIRNMKDIFSGEINI